MSRNLANYTTAIPAAKTAYELVAMLGEKGARSIEVQYEGGNPEGLSFRVEIGIGENAVRINYQLPCNWRGAAAVMKQHQKATKKTYAAQTRDIDPAHARNVAWRCLHDWLRAQFALIEIGAAKLDQVMLPYAICPDGQTVYDRMISSGFGRALPPAKEPTHA